MALEAYANANECAAVAHRQPRWRAVQNYHTQNVLRVLVVLGVGMIMGDGVLTPAISVVSACEGLQQASESITRSEQQQHPAQQAPSVLFQLTWLCLPAATSASLVRMSHAATLGACRSWWNHMSSQFC
jgi:hypothetical protein